jgi:hypothetical protein
LNKEGAAFSHNDNLTFILWYGLLTVSFGLPLATVAGLPVWLGLVVAAGIMFGVPLFALHVVGRFSPDWATRIFVWHLYITSLAFGVLVLAGAVALVWRWVVA